MKSVLRVMPLVVLAALVLGLVLPAVAQDSMMMEATCGGDYAGNLKSVEAVDKYTVKFSFCTPDPAFPSKAAFTAFAIHKLGRR